MRRATTPRPISASSTARAMARSLGAATKPRVVTDEPDSSRAATSERSLTAHCIGTKAMMTDAAHTNASTSSDIGA